MQGVTLFLHSYRKATFAILTTAANELVAYIHTRMPVILRREDEAHWLDQAWPVEAAQALLAPFPADLMTVYEVSAKVNAPAYTTRWGLSRSHWHDCPTGACYGIESMIHHRIFAAE